MSFLALWRVDQGLSFLLVAERCLAEWMRDDEFLLAVNSKAHSELRAKKSKPR